jgi:arginyl-tRNA synthetase
MPIAMELKNKTREAVAQAISAAIDSGELTLESVPEVLIEKPRERTHGDFATNAAMVLAKQAKMPPRKLAELIVAKLAGKSDHLESVEIAGPGFINFRLKKAWLAKVAPEVLAAGPDYGTTDVGKGTKIQVEFVSANPTGPLHMGNARGAGIGSVLASVLAKAGYTVEKEFYINDAGNQIENFGKSLDARFLELLGEEVEFPEDGYHGSDIIDLMKEYVAENGEDIRYASPEKRRETFIGYSLGRKLTAIKTALGGFGVSYDVWFSESSLHQSGAVEATLAELKKCGAVYEKDGAIWLNLVKYGEEKDEVLVRSNGISTYFAADIAYHRNKFERGFDTVINIWGADHHGHVSRMKAAMASLGYNPERLEVIIMQLVRLYRGGEIVRMSKRSGEMVTLNDLVEEVGIDAARYFFVMRSSDSHLDFDLDLAKSESNDNPVYYIQYAHARISSIFRQLAERNIPLPLDETGDFSLLVEPSEAELLKVLADFPGEVAMAALGREPHRIARYALDLASAFHSFYNSCRCIGEEENLQNARILLTKATRITLRNTLAILGVKAPEQM